MTRRILWAVLLSLVANGVSWGQPDPGEETPAVPPVYVSNEYLYWWMRGSQMYPLITTSPAGTPTATAGVLGQSGTILGLGNERVNAGPRHGWRFLMGAWLNDEQTLGVETQFFLLQAVNTQYDVVGDSSTILARPFVDVNTGKQAARLVSVPGEAAGNIAFAAATSEFISAGVCAREIFWQDGAEATEGSEGWNLRVGSLLGYRFLRLSDRMSMIENVKGIGAFRGNPAGTVFETYERFDSDNYFHGADVGLTGEFRFGSFVVESSSRLLIGANTNGADIFGYTVTTSPGAAPGLEPGFLTGPFNINSQNHTRSNAMAIPEFTFKVGCQLTPMLRAHLGYTFLYWHDVIRASELVDPFQDAPGKAIEAFTHPRFQYVTSDVWLQGVSLGMELRY